MSLRYEVIQGATLFGSKSSAFALTEVALTGDYADNRKVFDGCTGASKLDIRYSYTTGAGESNNSLNIFIEESSDGTNWFTIPNESVSTGTSTITARTHVNADNTGAASTIKGSLGLDIFYDKIRISVKETGVATNYGTIYAEASLLG